MIAASMAPARARSSRAMEGMSWVGLIAGLLLIASASCLAATPPTPRALYGAAISPDQVVAWAQAICTAVGLVIATANGAAIAWHRWGRPARKGKGNRHRFTPTPAGSAQLDPKGGA